MASLYKMDWDTIEQLIEEELDKHMRTFGYFYYFIINDETLLVKVYDDNKMLVFTVKMILHNNRLETVEVS